MSFQPINEDFIKWKYVTNYLAKLHLSFKGEEDA